MTTTQAPQKTSQRSTAQTQHSSQCSDSQCRAPTHEQIAFRAYEIYVKTGRKQGQCKQNWQQAEQDLNRHDQKPPQFQSPSPTAAAAHSSHAR